MSQFRRPTTASAPARRQVLLGGLGLTGVLLAGTAFAHDGQVHLFVTTYAGEDGGGLYPLSFTAATDSWKLGTPSKQLANISFACYSPKHGLHYLAQEVDAGRIIAARISHDGQVETLAEVSAEGRSPCYIALNKAETHLVCANYMSGSIAVYALDPATGLPKGAAQTFVNTGKGPNTNRQEAPHAHWAQFAPDGRTIYAVDLGTDQILGFPFNPKTGTMGKMFVALSTAPGAGPRHMAFAADGRTALIANELNNTLSLARRRRNGTLDVVETMSTLPPGFTAHNQVAHIALSRDGKRVYVSNRGHNSIAVFAVSKGKLSLVQHVSTGGDWPRFFLMLEQQSRIIVANQNSGTLHALQIAKDGTLQLQKLDILVPRAIFIGGWS